MFGFGQARLALRAVLSGLVTPVPMVALGKDDPRIAAMHRKMRERGRNRLRRFGPPRPSPQGPHDVAPGIHRVTRQQVRWAGRKDSRSDARQALLRAGYAPPVVMAA